MNLSKCNIYVQKMSIHERIRLVREVKTIMQYIMSIQKNKPIMLFCTPNVHTIKFMRISLCVSTILKEHEIPVYQRLLETITNCISKNRMQKVKLCCELEVLLKTFETIHFERKMNLSAAKIYDLLYV